jgi:hypothetical protein
MAIDEEKDKAIEWVKTYCKNMNITYTHLNLTAAVNTYMNSGESAAQKFLDGLNNKDHKSDTVKKTLSNLAGCNSPPKWVTAYYPSFALCSKTFCKTNFFTVSLTTLSETVSYLFLSKDISNVVKKSATS